MGLIYKVVNRINGKIYVGLTRKALEERKKLHIHAAKYSRHYSLFHKAIRKYGAENFEWSILEECNDELLSKREQHYILENKSWVRHPETNGYNLTPGGETLFGTSGENHWLKRMETSERETWLSKYRLGDHNPNYQNGDSIRGKKHYLNRFTPEEKEKWLDSHIRGDANYQAHLSKKELKDKCWVNKLSPEAKSIYIKSISGDNNPFKKKLDTDPEFRRQCEINWASWKPPRNNKIWKIKMPCGQTFRVNDLPIFLKIRGINKSTFGVARFYKRLHKGYLAEEYNPGLDQDIPIIPQGCFETDCKNCKIS